METKIRALLQAILPTYSGFVADPIPVNCILMKSNRKNELMSMSAPTGLIDHDFEIELLTKEYDNLILYHAQIIAMLESIKRTTQTYFIQAVNVDGNRPESWEPEIKMNRKYIQFTISYQV